MVACEQKTKKEETVVIQIIWGTAIQVQKSKEFCVTGVR